MLPITPNLSLLTSGQMDQVHEKALAILSKTGIRVDSPRAVEQFSGAGCRIEDKTRVRIPSELIERSLALAPETIEIFNRTGEKRFSLGRDAEGGTRFGVGVTNLNYQDPLTDKISPFSLAHIGIAARLADALPRFDILSTPGIARDLPPERADLHSLMAMIANTTKPLVMLISEQSCFRPALEMIAEIFGEISEHPFVIPYFNPITPLVLNSETAEKMEITIKAGLPFVYNNYGMSGATCPITPGGTLSLLLAELLAGIVYAQVLKPGTPIIAGSLPAGFNMQNMMSTYSPHTMLINLGCAEMMARYGIPHSGTSGSGPGWGPDLTSGGMFWMNHLTSLLGKVGMAPFVGGNFDSMAFSPAAVVYADEVIRQARLFREGFDFDDASVNLDEIDTMGPGANFLAAPSTGKRFREFRFVSGIWPEYTLDQWQENECPDAGRLLREHTAATLEKHLPPDDHDDLMRRGDQFIADLK